MSERPKFEQPTTLEEEHGLVLERSKYLLEHITSQDKELEKAKEINGIDHLTGARNRQEFDRELSTSLKMIRGELVEKRLHGAETPQEISLILLDADYFKNINDTYGHPAGDEVLKEIARTLRESIRDVDIAARWGGEEFAVLLKGADLKLAVRKAEELREKIAQLSFKDYSGMKVTASFGVTSSKISTNEQELMKLVDDALYLAKKRGRNRVEAQSGA